MKAESIIPNSLTRPKSPSHNLALHRYIERLLAASLSFSTTLLLGACLQGILLLLVPRIWILLPAAIVLFSRTAKTLAITFSLIPNPQMEGAIPYRTTAIIPDAQGEFNPECHASHEPVTVVILRVRPNHPLGFFAPGLRQFGMFGRRIAADLDQNAPDNGFMGISSYYARTVTDVTELHLLTYWRSVQHVLEFTSGSVHRDVVSFWDANAKDLKHVGINHELYQVNRCAYESVSVNFQPTGIGATSFFRKGDQLVGGIVPDQWVSPLVDARQAHLRTTRGRLGGWSSDTWTQEKNRSDDLKGGERLL